MDSLRKFLNKQQTKLRESMMDPDQHDIAIQLFMDQHAALHSVRVTSPEKDSLEDAILNEMTEDQMRRIPQGREHSVVWTIWHIARIEDITMNILVADAQQTFLKGNWPDKLKITLRDSGNAMDKKAVENLSDQISLSALRDYRVAVGIKTREIVIRMQPSILNEKVKLERLQRVSAEGAVVPAASGIIDYWGKRTIAGLLLMPATRHNLVHLNEALNLKRRQ